MKGREWELGLVCKMKKFVFFIKKREEIIFKNTSRVAGVRNNRALGVTGKKPSLVSDPRSQGETVPINKVGSTEVDSWPAHNHACTYMYTKHTHNVHINAHLYMCTHDSIPSHMYICMHTHAQNIHTQAHM